MRWIHFTFVWNLRKQREKHVENSKNSVQHRWGRALIAYGSKWEKAPMPHGRVLKQSSANYSYKVGAAEFSKYFQAMVPFLSLLSFDYLQLELFMREREKIVLKDKKKAVMQLKNSTEYFILNMRKFIQYAFTYTYHLYYIYSRTLFRINYFSIFQWFSYSILIFSKAPLK